MDLICDRVIRQLREDRKRDSIRVQLTLRSAYRPGRFATEVPDKVECNHEIEFKPTYPCDGVGGAVISVCGVRFRPDRSVIKTLASAWLEELAERSGEDQGRMSCVLELRAVAGAQDLYNNRVRFEYDSRSGKNKKAMNRMVEALMQIKGLCENMVEL